MARATGYRDAVEYLVGYDETDLIDKWKYSDVTPAVQMVSYIYNIDPCDIIPEMRRARRRLDRQSLEIDRRPWTSPPPPAVVPPLGTLSLTKMVTPPYDWIARVSCFYGRGDSQEEAILHLWSFLENHHPEEFEKYRSAFPQTSG